MMNQCPCSCQLPVQLASDGYFSVRGDGPHLPSLNLRLSNLFATIAGGGLAARAKASTSLPPCFLGCAWLRAQVLLHQDIVLTVFPLYTALHKRLQL